MRNRAVNIVGRRRVRASKGSVAIGLSSLLMVSLSFMGISAPTASGNGQNRINDEVQEDCFVVATGGVSHVYKPLTDKIHVGDRLHTLKGLYFLGRDLEATASI